MQKKGQSQGLEPGGVMRIGAVNRRACPTKRYTEIGFFPNPSKMQLFFHFGRSVFHLGISQALLPARHGVAG
jgi:hypothetical protein